MTIGISFEADFWPGMSENYDVILGHLKHRFWNGKLWQN